MDLLNRGNIWVRPHKDYHGTDYCKQVIADVLVAMNWGTQKYRKCQIKQCIEK